MDSDNSHGQPAGKENELRPAAEKRRVSPNENSQSSLMHKPRKASTLNRVLLSATIVLVILSVLIITASHTNTGRYYLKVSAGAVEIWQGTFSPAGKKRLLIMPGIIPPQKIQSVYTQRQVYPLIFRYYVDKADMLMNLPGMPDFVGIKSYLNRSLVYAFEQEQRQIAIARLNAVDRIILLYKADVAASKGSMVGLMAAKKYLNAAAELDPDEIQANLIKQKSASIQKLITTMGSTDPKALKPLSDDKPVAAPKSGK